MINPLQKQPPKHICILRLSAIGDVCHTLPVVRTIQQHWPSTELTWIIGKTEASLLSDIPGIRFIIFDKSQGLRAYIKLKRQLSGLRFDILLHMQMSLRASVASLLVNAPIKLGFDKQRAKDYQYLFTNSQIKAKQNQHVLDSLFGFCQAIGINDKQLIWNIPVSDQDKSAIDEILTADQPTLVISPCSSKAYRNWFSERYAEVADYAIKKYNLRIVLSGGSSEVEKAMGRDIQDHVSKPIVNLIGKTNLKQSLYLFQQATMLIAPDSGPAHMATAVNTPVIGLYACTNPDRARPYLSQNTVVNKYPDAIKTQLGKDLDNIPWGTRIRDSAAMRLITVEDVTAEIDRLMRARYFLPAQL